MPTIRFSVTTSATPEELVAALTDFGPGRRDLFGNSSDDYLKVHSQGPTGSCPTASRSGSRPRPAR